MLNESTTQFVAVWNVDAIAPVSQLNQAYMCLLSDNVTLAYPYDGRFWQVNFFNSCLFHRKHKINFLTGYDVPRNLMSGYYSVGGAFLVNVHAYRKCGWENEHFIGWGPEDVERYHRLEILGERIVRVPGSLYHLFHTRGINSGDYDNALSEITKREYSRVCSMMPEELRSYISTWNWVK